MYVVCRPIHGLELLDVLTLDSPPWGGNNYVGRVTSYREEYNIFGRWHQVIGIGATSLKDPGNQPTRSKRRKGRRSRRRPPPVEPPDELPPPMELPWMVPIGGIILWSGASANIPAGWALCDGNNSTPDLRNSFVIGAGDTYSPDDTGGVSTIDLAHTHGPGTLNTDSDSHDHDVDSGTTADDSHDHDVDSGDTGAGTAHAHGAGTYATSAASSPTGTFDTDDSGGNATTKTDHVHNLTGGSGNESSHTHGSGTLNTASDTHSHGPGTLNTDSDSHDHNVDSGATASALADATSILNPYYALCYIMRIA